LPAAAKADKAAKKAILDLPDLKVLREHGDQQDRKGLTESRDLRDHKELQARQELQERQVPRDLQDRAGLWEQLDLRDPWDFQVCKDRRDCKVNKDPKGLPVQQGRVHLVPIPTLRTLD
jgi:hypothetical protein